MKKPRVLFAGLFHETNGFVGEPTRWSDFKVFCGRDVFARRDDGSVTDGFLTAAEREGLDVVPTLDAWALPGGKVEDAAFEEYWREFEAVARPALTGGVDAIFLVLHGAMATPGQEDAEGELLRRIRSLPGAEALPIFGVLDLHANVTPAMCALANGLVAYRENPHTDAKETGARATQLLARCLRERRVPHMSWGRPPVVWAPPGTGTQSDPMKSLAGFARRVEATEPEIWACNIAAGFSFTDMPETGMSLSVVSVGPATTDRKILEEGARLAWDLREKGNALYPSADDVVRQLMLTSQTGTKSGPVLLIEPADNIGAGAAGDGTGLLRALVKHRVPRALIAITDPQAVAALANTPAGHSQRLAVGGRGSSLDEGPVDLEVTLVSRSDGRFTLEDPYSHLAAMSGVHYDMGPCVVVRSGGLALLLTSRKTPPFDLGQLRSQGIEPRDFAYIGIKAAIAHKRAYDPIASGYFYVTTPGPCSSDLASLPWAKVRRPVWPLDPLAPFACRFS